nr:hypothetical protein [uncultured Helicobacter sp.]
MKKIWLYVCVVCVILGEMSALPLHKIEGKCVEPKKFNKNQKQVILKAFKYGAKDGFGYTMAAIAWKESCAGEYRVNFTDPSAGIYHAHIPGIIKKYKQKDSAFMRNMVGELLMRDDEFASQSAFEELSYWHKVRRGNWYEVIKSYNKGFSWEKDKERDKMAQAYFEDVAKRVKELQTYIPKISSSASRLVKKDYALEFLNNATQSVLGENNAMIKDSVASYRQKHKNTKSKEGQKFIILEE